MKGALTIRGKKLLGPIFPRLNVYGEEIQTFVPGDGTFGGTVTRGVSLVWPIYMSKQKDNPIDTELLRIGVDISMPDKRQKFFGVPINLGEFPEIYHRLKKLRGNDLKLLKYGNKGMKDYLNALVTRKVGQSIIYFDRSLNDEDRGRYIVNQVASDYLKAAKEKILLEFPVLNQFIMRQRFEAIRQRLNLSEEEEP